jgi:hypothetical protein
MLLKSHGETVAELTLLKDDTFEVTGGTSDINVPAGTLIAKGDNLTVGMSRQGKVFPITIKADEVEEYLGKQKEVGEQQAVNRNTPTRRSRNQRSRIVFCRIADL